MLFLFMSQRGVTLHFKLFFTEKKVADDIGGQRKLFNSFETFLVIELYTILVYDSIQGHWRNLAGDHMGRTEGDQSSPRGCRGGGTREWKISANRL